MALKELGCGSELDGRFRIIEKIAQGGMGCVYKAHQIADGTLVAVKTPAVFPDEFTSKGADILRRLRDEARAAASVRHKNLVSFIDAGNDSVYGPYIVFEFVRGMSLREKLERDGPMGWESAYEEVGKPILAALSALHKKGIIHRDIKPENVLVDENGQCKLTDLGLAVFDGRTSETATGTFVGTVGYLAPERAIDPTRKATPVTDIYSMAVMLVELASGKIPFQGEGVGEVLRSQLDSKVTDRKLMALGFEQTIARILSEALSSDAAERPATVPAFKRMISRVTGRETRQSRAAKTLEASKVVVLEKTEKKQFANWITKKVLIPFVLATILVMILLLRKGRLAVTDLSQNRMKGKTEFSLLQKKLFSTNLNKWRDKDISRLGTLYLQTDDYRNAGIKMKAGPKLLGHYSMAVALQRYGKVSSACLLYEKIVAKWGLFSLYKFPQWTLFHAAEMLATKKERRLQLVEALLKHTDDTALDKESLLTQHIACKLYRDYYQHKYHKRVDSNPVPGAFLMRIWKLSHKLLSHNFRGADTTSVATIFLEVTAAVATADVQKISVNYCRDVALGRAKPCPDKFRIMIAAQLPLQRRRKSQIFAPTEYNDEILYFEKMAHKFARTPTEKVTAKLRIAHAQRRFGMNPESEANFKTINIDDLPANDRWRYYYLRANLSRDRFLSNNVDPDIRHLDAAIEDYRTAQKEPGQSKNGQILNKLNMTLIKKAGILNSQKK